MSKKFITIIDRIKLCLRNLFWSFIVSVFILLVPFFVIISNNNEGMATQQEYKTILPNSEIQSLIESIAMPTGQDKKIFSGSGEKFLKSKLSELVKLAGGDHAKLVPQLVYYSMHVKDWKNAMAAGFIVEQLKISKQNIALGLIPYLDTNDKALQKEMYNWLGGVDVDESTKKINFDLYKTVICENKLAPPKGLIKYMYQKSPETALSILYDIYSDKPSEKKSIVESGQIISSDINKRYYGSVEGKPKISKDAKERLSKLSQSKDWYVRLYVAEILRQHSEFQSQDVIERLKNDKDPLVQEVVAEITKKPIK